MNHKILPTADFFKKLFRRRVTTPILSFGLLTLLLTIGGLTILPTKATRELVLGKPKIAGYRSSRGKGAAGGTRVIFNNPLSSPAPLPPLAQSTSAPLPASTKQFWVRQVLGWSVNQFPLNTNIVPKSTNMIYVNPTLGIDNPSAGNKETAPYRTITFALQQAQPGTTIQLAPGSYSASSGEQFPLVVKSGVILQGDESTKGQNVLIWGGGAYLSRTFARQSTAVLAQQDSEIKGITVTNPNSRGTGIWIESGNPIIQNNKFINNLREGIFATGNAVPKIIGNVFTQNQGNGLSVAKAAQGEIRGNLFENTGFGIVISETATPQVIENTIINNRVGVVISHYARPVLRHNRIENNQQYGVIVIAQAQPDLGTASSPGNNILRYNGQYDLYNLTDNEILMANGNYIALYERGKVEVPKESSIEQ